MVRTRSLRHTTAAPQRPRRSIAAVGVLAFLTLVALVSLLAPVYRPGRTVSIADATADTTPAVSPATEAAAASLAERPVYPYSIVAGGATSVDELKKAIDADPVVAGHYSNFDLTKTRVEKLTKPQVAFVSYRMGNDIYWTRKPLVIRAGERILTDGVNVARTRCANQLSTIPGPTSELEPPAATLDTPVLRPLPTPPIGLVLPPGGSGLGIPPPGSYPPSGIPIPPGVTFSVPPIGSPAPTDTPEQTPPDDETTPQGPPLPLPPGPPAPPPGPPAPPPPGPPITIDDPILPPPPIGPPSYDPPGNPEDRKGSEDPPNDPPNDPPISVPEPATSVLLLIAGGACAIGRKLTTRADD